MQKQLQQIKELQYLDLEGKSPEEWRELEKLKNKEATDQDELRSRTEEINKISKQTSQNTGTNECMTTCRSQRNLTGSKR